MRLRKNEGFTLLELAAVMAIVVLAAAIAVPVLDQPLADVKLHTDARQMAGVLRATRQQAVTSGQSATVVFYPAGAKYMMMGQTATKLKDGVEFVGATTFTTKYASLPACVFSPTGAPTSGGTVTLTNGHRNLYLIVNPVAGRVRLSETPPQDW